MDMIFLLTFDINDVSLISFFKKLFFLKTVTHVGKKKGKKRQEVLVEKIIQSLNLWIRWLIFTNSKNSVSIPIFNPSASLKFCRALPSFWFVYFWVGSRAFHSISLFGYFKGTWVFVHFLQASVIRLVFRHCLRSQIGRAFSCWLYILIDGRQFGIFHFIVVRVCCVVECFMFAGWVSNVVWVHLLWVFSISLLLVCVCVCVCVCCGVEYFVVCGLGEKYVVGASIMVNFKYRENCVYKFKTIVNMNRNPNATSHLFVHGSPRVFQSWCETFLSKDCIQSIIFFICN